MTDQTTQTTVSQEKVRLDVVQYVLGLLPSGSDWHARAVYLAFEIAGNRDEDHIRDAAERLEAAHPGFIRRVEDFARDINANDAATYLATLGEMARPEHETAQHVEPCGFCERCGDPILKAWSDGEREPRADRRYCSQACRQAAYRDRQAAEAPPH